MERERGGEGEGEEEGEEEGEGEKDSSVYKDILAFNSIPTRWSRTCIRASLLIESAAAFNLVWM